MFNQNTASVTAVFFSCLRKVMAKVYENDMLCSLNNKSTNSNKLTQTLHFDSFLLHNSVIQSLSWAEVLLYYALRQNQLRI